MSNRSAEISLGAVHQGAFTSRARDAYGADASSPITLLSGSNASKVELAIRDYKESGADQFGAATFGSNPHRATGNQEDWIYDPSAKLALPTDYRDVNDAGVSISHRVAGKPVPALIAPVTDTIGRHDKQWQSLGKNQVSWAIQRHLGQVEQLLSNPNVSGVWVEALRYRNEAKALAELSREFNAKLLVVSFRLENNGDFPDSEHSNFSIAEAQEELQEIANKTKVITGINCTGASAVISRLGDAGDRAGVVYPNTNDYAKGSPEDAVRIEDLHKLGLKRTPDQSRELEFLENRLVTTREEYEQAWKIGRERDPNCTISACCGATPEIIEWAHQFHNSAETLRVL